MDDFSVETIPSLHHSSCKTGWVSSNALGARNRNLVEKRRCYLTLEWKKTVTKVGTNLRFRMVTSKTKLIQIQYLASLKSG